VDWIPFRDRKTTASLEKRRGNRVGVKDGQEKTWLERMERKLRIIPGSRRSVRERKADVRWEMERLRPMQDLDRRNKTVSFSAKLLKKDALVLESNFRALLLDELHDDWAAFGGFPFPPSVAVAMVEPSVPAIPFVSRKERRLLDQKQRDRVNAHDSIMVSASGGTGALSWDDREALEGISGEHGVLDDALSIPVSTEWSSTVPAWTPRDLTWSAGGGGFGNPVPLMVPISTQLELAADFGRVPGQEQTTTLTPGVLVDSYGVGELCPEPASWLHETRIVSSGTNSSNDIADVAERQTGQHEQRGFTVLYDAEAMDSISRGFVQRCELIENWLEYYSELLDDLDHDDRNREYEISEIWKEFTSEVADHLGLSDAYSDRGCRICVFDVNLC
jgi:hypothetical protein